MDGANCMGRSTPENTQCDTPTTLPNRQGARRGAKRTPLRENVLEFINCCATCTSEVIYLFWATFCSFDQGFGGNYKGVVVECGNKSFTISGIGWFSRSQSRSSASNTCKAPSFSRKVTWITGKLGTTYIVNQVSYL